MRKKVTPENLKVLVVDDVKSMRTIVRHMLKNLNISQTPFMAENGLEGLKILNSNHIDLAIIDWKMPVMNGAQMLEAIRSDRQLRDMPVLMVTAESEKDIVIEAAEIEVEGYLLKPLSPAVLEEKILTIIEHLNHPDRATLHARKARELEEIKDYSTAIKHMKCAVQLKPGASRLLRKLGLLHQKNGSPEKLEKWLLKAASANPEDAVTRFLLGEFYRKRNQLESAVRYYLETIELTRKFSQEAIQLGTELLTECHSEQARTLFLKIISKSPKDIELIEKIIGICIDHNQLPFSLTLIKNAIHNFPGNYDLVYQAGIVCQMMDDMTSALQHFLEVDKHEFNHIDVKLKIARIYHLREKVIQADNYLNAILRINPTHEKALALKREL
jgi:CheY-like chemotaxis protein